MKCKNVYRRGRFHLFVSIVSLGRNEFQQTLLAYLVKAFFERNFYRILLAGTLHIWTVQIALKYGGTKAIWLTVLMPIVSELYWLVFLCINRSPQFYLYLLALTGFLYLFRWLNRLEPINFYFYSAMSDGLKKKYDDWEREKDRFVH